MFTNYAGQDQSASYIGERVILSPTGKELARAEDQVCWIEAKLEREEIASARARLNYLVDYQLEK